MVVYVLSAGDRRIIQLVFDLLEGFLRREIIVCSIVPIGDNGLRTAFRGKLSNVLFDRNGRITMALTEVTKIGSNRGSYSVSKLPRHNLTINMNVEILRTIQRIDDCFQPNVFVIITEDVDAIFTAICKVLI